MLRDISPANQNNQYPLDNSHPEPMLTPGTLNLSRILGNIFSARPDQRFGKVDELE
jgi:hypothetical protein